MTSNSEMYIQLTRPARKDQIEKEVFTITPTRQQASDKWRDEKWGALDVTITDDPNFKPTETFEIPVYNSTVDISEILSEEDALALLEELN